MEDLNDTTPAEAPPAEDNGVADLSDQFASDATLTPAEPTNAPLDLGKKKEK